ncbi:hypothetical protein CsSME_00000505 [Camellia sinensis var. sinensis]
MKSFVERERELFEADTGNDIEGRSRPEGERQRERDERNVLTAKRLSKEENSLPSTRIQTKKLLCQEKFAVFDSLTLFHLTLVLIATGCY